MLFILFGLAGAGKNFVGEVMAPYFKMHFWDADTVLPQAMRNAIDQKKIFTQAMRDDFTEVIITEITALQKKYPQLIVAQALYKEKNRQQIATAFPHAKFIHIQAPPAIILSRLNLPSSQIDPSYAAKMGLLFEPPLLPHLVIQNESDQQSIIQQCKRLQPPLFA